LAWPSFSRLIGDSTDCSAELFLPPLGGVDPRERIDASRKHHDSDVVANEGDNLVIAEDDERRKNDEVSGNLLGVLTNKFGKRAVLHQVSPWWGSVSDD
jgi:hypothetical protein